MFLLCRAGVLRSVSRRLSSRFLATRTRAAWERTAETVKSDSISGVASQSWGRALVAGGCFAGIGGLCFYGLGFAPEAGAVDRAMFWPPVVKERIQKTYTVSIFNVQVPVCYQSLVLSIAINKQTLMGGYFIPKNQCTVLN